MVLPLAADNVTVNTMLEVPAFPSAMLGLLMERDGIASSSVMVAVWVKVPKAVALVGLPMLTTTVSLSSSMLSGVMVMVMVAVVLPAGMVRGDAVIE